METADLCQRCRAIDIEKLFERDYSRHDYPDALPTLVLGRISSNSFCRLCRFFLSMVPADRKDSELSVFKDIAVRRSQVEQIASIQPRRATLVIRGVEDPRIIFPTTFINYNKTAETPSLLDPARVNYEPLRKWCKLFGEWDKGRPRDVRELPLLVIDCFTRKLIPVNGDCEYFALSYVWGPAPAEESSPGSDDLPGRLPATVEDAIVVVKELGSRYLWVDRYCLDRSNLAEFQAQLNRMAGIYRNATATIIAAAGPDADYGLPGVGHRQRFEQPRVQVGEYTLWSSMSDPRNLVKDSIWMSRAWTYQEGVCSSNWIAFTDEQVFYQRSNTGIERMERGWKESCEMFPDGGLGPADPKSPLPKMYDTLKTNTGALHQHIERYTTRQLSYESDVLNGMLGILQRCGNGSYPMNHYFGVPILGPLNLHRLTSPRAVDRHWTLTEAFLVGLFWITEGWEVQGPGQRRPGFPSWSWTGWRGGAYGKPSMPLIQYGLSSRSEIELKVSVFHSGRLTDWEKMCYDKDWDLYEDISLLPQELYIQAPTMMVNVFRAPEHLEGTACSKSERPEAMKWVIGFSDDECDVLMKVNLVDAAVEEALGYPIQIPLKAIFLRQVSLEQDECTVSRQHNYVRCSALLVKEGEDGATKCGILEFTPDSYLVYWKLPSVPPYEKFTPEKREGVATMSGTLDFSLDNLREYWKDPYAPPGENSPSKGEICWQCRRAMACLTRERTNELVKLI